MSSVSGFYRQKKKNPVSTKSSKKQPSHAATSGSVLPQPLIQQDECNGNEALLRQFDLNMAYGPCIGISRLARWERAQKLGLNPPQEIEKLLESGKVQAESLWNGRI